MTKRQLLRIMLPRHLDFDGCDALVAFMLVMLLARGRSRVPSPYWRN